MRLFHRTLLAVPLAATLLLTGPAIAQTKSERIGSQYIPSDAVATIVLSVADAMTSPAVQSSPVEVVDAWCEENLGIPASRIDKIKVVISTPGPGEPMFAMVATLLEDFDVAKLNSEFVHTEQEIQVDGKTCYAFATPVEAVMHVKDARTVIVASETYLDTVLRSAEASSSRGPLAKMAEGAGHTGHLSLLVAVEPVRPMITGLLQSQADQIPPPLAPFTRAPELLDAILIRVNLDDPVNGIGLVMLATDDAAAEKLTGMINDGLRMGRQIGLAQLMLGQQPDGDEITKATAQYAERMADKIIAALTPDRRGRRLTFRASTAQNIAVPAVLAGLLLPAIQAARQAANRTTSTNNFKQIGLAMHNYHSAYGRLPGNVLDEDGTPLLSWRVAILPFIEEVDLYHQFHLEEPWDSPHNIKLVELMPAIFLHPNRQPEQGATVYQRPSGETFLMSPGNTVKFRDVFDGLSNTIMVVETTAERSVAWSKPEDIEIDADNPVAGISDGEGPGFTVLFADGSVQVLDHDLDGKTIQAMLTKSGKELIPAR